MNYSTAPLYELKEFNDIKDDIKEKQGAILVSGCIDSQKSHLMHGLGED